MWFSKKKCEKNLKKGKTFGNLAKNVFENIWFENIINKRFE